MESVLDIENNRHIQCFVIIPFDKEFQSVWDAIQEVAANLASEGKDVGVHRASENRADSKSVTGGLAGAVSMG